MDAHAECISNLHTENIPTFCKKMFANYSEGVVWNKGVFLCPVSWLGEKIYDCTSDEKKTNICSGEITWYQNNTFDSLGIACGVCNKSGVITSSALLNFRAKICSELIVLLKHYIATTVEHLSTRTTGKIYLIDNPAIAQRIGEIIATISYLETALSNKSYQLPNVISSLFLSLAAQIIDVSGGRAVLSDGVVALQQLISMFTRIYLEE